ncbi:pentapeptide repeat-containing protein [Nonomuraea aurantiaca]|uniref:pentapeptide repeat-containing protein n=1 Tax=Nonomuraea aurantiaca TaxID=2878562 RepID=UPI001CDA533D|nr:pentapeptide repeat-containing protein [Nonomuraea aurantiaca]MCA2222565.1 pentapeptide repeat-containing protein [Nonomuraea aurantiaca]
MGGSVYRRFMEEVDWEDDLYDLDRGEDLYRGKMRGMNLVGANLNDANLTEADLRDANLDHANLGRAYLTRANLAGASLRGTNLACADLDGTSLDGVTWSMGPEGTQWPEGLAETMRARSREIEPRVWRVAADVPRQAS